MLLIVGLGNPGEKYARHRHNIGFLVADAIAGRHDFSAPRQKFRGDICEGFLSARGRREKVLILKPGTYMNESGRSVGDAVRFHKVEPANVIVIHDELDLEPGKVRVKTGGGNAGHNGLKSIAAHIGGDFRRIRIGIGHPGAKDRVSGHVLGDFSKADQDWLGPLIDNLARAAPMLVAGDKEFQNELGRLRGPSPGDKPAQTAAGKSPSATAKPKSPERAMTEKKPDDQPPGNPFADALKKLIKRS